MTTDKSAAIDAIQKAETILVIQADNPDGDSLASALALEEILGEAGKQVHLYCGVAIPDYLKYLQGWDRVELEIPKSIDASIVVDTSANILLEKLNKSSERSIVASKPTIVLDHHAEVACDIPYATHVINDGQAVATGEVIYSLAEQAGWSMSVAAKTFIASSILSDSLGLSSEGTTPRTYRLMGDLIESGVDRPALEEARRSLNLMPESIFRYKARLIERTELSDDGRVALVTVPQSELNEFSPLYNPKVLILGDMLQIDTVKVAIVIKAYKDGKITGAIRCTQGIAIAADLAAHFGGGGHRYASGFKIVDGHSLAQVKTDCLRFAKELLNQTI